MQFIFPLLNLYFSLKFLIISEKDQLLRETAEIQYKFLNLVV